MGGAERANLELIDGLKNNGVNCFAILPTYGPLIEELKKRDVPFKVFPYMWWMYQEGSPFWKRVARVIWNFVMILPIILQVKRWGIDVIFTNTITVCVGAFAAKILRLPHIWHMHEFGYEGHRLVYDLGTKISLWLMNKLSTACIANSYAVAEKYRRFIPDEKLKVVYYAVCIMDQMDQYFHSFLELQEQINREADIRCAIVGTLQQGKGQEDAIKTIGELRCKGVKARLYVVGEGSPRYKQYLLSLVAQGDLKDYVTFLGYIANPIQVMQCVDVILMCSTMEAFGRVTVEAMRAGKPVIGARSGGTTELIQEGFNGLLYTPGNYKELAEKNLYLYEHPEVMKCMGENGQKWVTEYFTVEHYAEKVFTILKQVFQPEQSI
jgi:glycosyltransferase involved in cell wall biosynthesis